MGFYDYVMALLFQTAVPQSGRLPGKLHFSSFRALFSSPEALSGPSVRAGFGLTFAPSEVTSPGQSPPTGTHCTRKRRPFNIEPMCGGRKNRMAKHGGRMVEKRE
ncbi:MAG: hypothetical protein EPN14_06780 [Gallionella sp.]|nr:MAG: hypothetical protein EPN14_06780 [Gallionella sp.]